MVYKMYFMRLKWCF